MGDVLFSFDAWSCCQADLYLPPFSLTPNSRAGKQEGQGSYDELVAQGHDFQVLLHRDEDDEEGGVDDVVETPEAIVEEQEGEDRRVSIRTRESEDLAVARGPSSESGAGQGKGAKAGLHQGMFVPRYDMVGSRCVVSL